MIFIAKDLDFIRNILRKSLRTDFKSYRGMLFGIHYGGTLCRFHCVPEAINSVLLRIYKSENGPYSDFGTAKDNGTIILKAVCDIIARSNANDMVIIFSAKDLFKINRDYIWDEYLPLCIICYDDYVRSILDPGQHGLYDSMY